MIWAFHLEILFLLWYIQNHHQLEKIMLQSQGYCIRSSIDFFWEKSFSSCLPPSPPKDTQIYLLFLVYNILVIIAYPTEIFPNFFFRLENTCLLICVYQTKYELLKYILREAQQKLCLSDLISALSSFSLARISYFLSFFNSLILFLILIAAKMILENGTDTVESHLQSAN